MHSVKMFICLIALPISLCAQDFSFICNNEALRKKAFKGDVQAQANYGLCLLIDKSDPNGLSKGLEMLKAAADKGNTLAMINLASTYLHGNFGVTKNVEEALRILNTASNSGSPMANMMLGNAYILGQGVPVDTKRGEILMQKAAELGDPTAMLNLAAFYRGGEYLPRNLELARLYAIKAKNNGMPMADDLLADIEKEANPSNPIHAEDLLKEAALKGDSASQFKLARIYLERKTQPELLKEAYKLLKASAKDNFLPAMIEIARIYDEGLGKDQDHVKAMKWIAIAAEEGFLKAQNMIANRYFDGKGVEKDDLQGMYWLRIAQTLGSNVATNNYNNRKNEFSADQLNQIEVQAKAWLESHIHVRHSTDDGYDHIAEFPGQINLPDDN